MKRVSLLWTILIFNGLCFCAWVLVFYAIKPTHEALSQVSIVNQSIDNLDLVESNSSLREIARGAILANESARRLIFAMLCFGMVCSVINIVFCWFWRRQAKVVTS